MIVNNRNISLSLSIYLSLSLSNLINPSSLWKTSIFQVNGRKICRKQKRRSAARPEGKGKVFRSSRILQNPLKFYFLPSNCPKLNKARQVLNPNPTQPTVPKVCRIRKRDRNRKIHNNNKRRQQTNKRQSFWRRAATEIEGNIVVGRQYLPGGWKGRER